MTELSDADKSKVQAETARKTLASKLPVEEILARVDRYNGAGLTSGEVLALREEISRLQFQVVTYHVAMDKIWSILSEKKA